MRRFPLAAIAAICLMLPLETATAQMPDSLPPEVTAGMIEAGAAIYAGAGLCAACHGADAGGTVGPNLKDDEWVHGDGSYESIVRRILEGVAADKSESGTPMPPRGSGSLSDDQVRAVAAYVWSLRFGDQ